MTDFLSTGGTPVRNLQNMLRVISLYYNNIPLIIPDGIFGKTTTDAVKTFQEAYSLPVNGKVDLVTFEEIVRVKRLAEEEMKPHRRTRIISDPSFIIYPGDTAPELTVIKAMVKNIAAYFDNINDVNEINDHNDEEFVIIIKQIQELAGYEANGNIDKKTFNIISYLYEIIPFS